MTPKRRETRLLIGCLIAFGVVSIAATVVLALSLLRVTQTTHELETAVGASVGPLGSATAPSGEDSSPLPSATTSARPGRLTPDAGAAAGNSDTGTPAPPTSQTSQPNSTQTNRATETPPHVGATERPTGGNLLANPLFEGEHNSTDIASWISDGRWDVSIKGDNPNPAWSAARTAGPAIGGSSGQPGIDAVIYQVVEGGGSQLSAEIACVQIDAEIVDVSILGSPGPNGPWKVLWQPFDVTGCNRAEWGPTLHADMTLPVAWAYYQFRIVARFAGEKGAAKVTNAWFTVD